TAIGITLTAVSMAGGGIYSTWYEKQGDAGQVALKLLGTSWVSTLAWGGVVAFGRRGLLFCAGFIATTGAVWFGFREQNSSKWGPWLMAALLGLNLGGLIGAGISCSTLFRARGLWYALGVTSLWAGGSILYYRQVLQESPSSMMAFLLET